MKLKHALVFTLSSTALTSAVMTACKTGSSGVKTEQNGDADSSKDRTTSETPPASPTVVSGQRCNTQPRSSKDLMITKYGPTCTELITKYPAIEDPQIAEDKRVLCPMLRILNKSKIFAGEMANHLADVANASMLLPISVGTLVESVREFGCAKPSCGAVAMAVSAGQRGKSTLLTGSKELVDIGKLHTAKGVAHDCGFTFAYNDTEVNDATREETLKIFARRAVDGRLTRDDVMATKADMCKRDYLLSKNGTLPTLNKVDKKNETLIPGRVDKVEADLIFTYLGGVDNGYILLSDIEKLFHAQIPVNKTKYLIDVALLAHVSLLK